MLGVVLMAMPNLNGYFVSHEGQFGLIRLPGNRTRLTGTTWYTDRVWPSAYWQLWSDYIIHHIHLRVLRQSSRRPSELPNSVEDSCFTEVDFGLPCDGHLSFLPTSLPARPDM